MTERVHAFSYLAPENHRHAIVFDIGVGVSLPIPNAPKDLKGRLTIKALVDTGASGSAISERFAKCVQLSSYRRMIVHAANGDSIVPVYTVDVFLPNGVVFQNTNVSEFSGGSDFDFIIGMDILMQGDLSITNANNQTLFSFRMPPDSQHTDYTKLQETVI